MEQNKSKYIVFVTPKAFSTLNKDVLPEDVEIVATPWIYMNLMEEGWDADRCDSIAYIVERESFKENKLEFKIKGDE